MKLTKKSFLYGAFALTLCVNSGCDDNINMEPEGIITNENFFLSASDFENALNASYNQLNVNSYGLWIDGTTDNGVVTHSWNVGYDMGRGIGNTASSFPLNKWDKNYISVQRTNDIIQNIDNFVWPNGEADTDRNRILGEARTLRAYFYLDLVSTFGRIMFYTVNPATVEESRQIKQIENPKEVYDFILKELEEAIPGLPEQPKNSSLIGKAAARLLRARTAAYAAGYLNDKSYFRITLQETGELLKTAPALGNFGSLFTNGNEEIDEVILVKTYSLDKTNSWGNFYNQSLGGYCVTTPVKSLADAYEYIGERNEDLPYRHKDPRFYETLYAPGMELRGKYFNSIPNNTIEKNGKVFFDPSKEYGALQDKDIWVGDVLGEGGGGEWNKTQTGLSWKKYCAEPETWTTYNAFIIFRYAEAYLLRAEALVETGGDNKEAKALVKVIRDRAGNTNDIDETVNTLYEGSLLKLIRNEQRVEFAQEGLRFYDLRRWNILLEEMNKPIEGIEYMDYSPGKKVRKVYTPAVREANTQRDFWWPIPQAEIDLNQGYMTQNANW